MTEKQILEELISTGDLEKAISRAENLAERYPEDWQWPYLLGKAYWRMGDKRLAITNYERACSIDSECPAAAALEMSRNIMDFFHRDQLNP